MRPCSTFNTSSCGRAQGQQLQTTVCVPGSHLSGPCADAQNHRTLQLVLQSPPTLGLPDPMLPFVQTVDEVWDCMTFVFLRKKSW